MTTNSAWCIHHPEEFADVRRKLICLDIPCTTNEIDVARLDDEKKLQEDIAPAIKAFQENPEYRNKFPALEQAILGCCDFYTWDALKDQAGILFSEAAQWELDRLDEACDPPQSYIIPTAHAVKPAIESAVYQRAHKSNLFGLAFSGGGNRSATFNLGILQGLAEKNLLPCVDFLSTVSGGSYIGSWLSTWIHREGGDVRKVEAKLKTGRQLPEADPIKALRQYSNFLTPKVGIFGADTWTIIATWLRNMMLNFAILISLIAVAMLIPRMLAMGLAPLIEYLRIHADEPGLCTQMIGVIGLIGLFSFLCAVFFIGLNITLLPSEKTPTPWLAKQSQGNVLRRVILPLMLSGFALSVWLWVERKSFLSHIDFLNPFSWTNLGTITAWTVFYLLVWVCGWFYASLQNDKNPQIKSGKRALGREFLVHFTFSFFAFVFGASLISLTLTFIDHQSGASEAIRHGSHLVVWGVPVMLSIFGLVMILLIGLIGRHYDDRSREWWSRMGGWLTVFVIGWTTVTAISLYSPAVFAWLHGKTQAWASSTLTLGWIFTTAGGVLMGSSSLTGKTGSSRSLERFVSIAPYVFILGLLIAVSVISQALLSPNQSCVDMKCDTLGNYVHQELTALEGTAWVTLFWSIGILIFISVLLGWRVDINKFSLYMMYRNRLVRAYLGASRVQRNPQHFTGFDEKDDVPLASIISTQASQTLQRPYHIINAALNLVKGDELAWQERKAAAFAFTPAFCGFEMPRQPRNMSAQQTTAQARGCYRPTSDYQRPESKDDEESGVKIGQALTVSGAAASPSMGYHSSPPLTFLMTLFNVRLGRWCANPRGDKWREPSPSSGLVSLIAELFGLTDANSNFLYLSDGGHFENLGIYELVRRRCKLIVAIDASEDEKSNFDDLGDSIRKCYTDFGIPIDINVNLIRADGPNKLSESHYAIGKIHYEYADVGGAQGILLYIKASLSGNEPADILNYAKREPSFPNQSTADQWFDESQFETYRKLGHHIASAMFGEFNGNGDTDINCKDRTKRMIEALQRKLVRDPPPELNSEPTPNTDQPK